MMNSYCDYKTYEHAWYGTQFMVTNMITLKCHVAMLRKMCNSVKEVKLKIFLLSSVLNGFVMSLYYTLLYVRSIGYAQCVNTCPLVSIIFNRYCTDLICFSILLPLCKLNYACPYVYIHTTN